MKIVSKTTNIFNFQEFTEGTPSDTSQSSVSRTFTDRTYVKGLSSTNTYSSSAITNFEKTNTQAKWSKNTSYGVGFVFKGLESGTYSLCLASGVNTFALHYAVDGTFNGSYAITENHVPNRGTFNIPTTSEYVVILFISPSRGIATQTTAYNVALEKGNNSSITYYEPTKKYGVYTLGNPVSPKNEVAEWGHTYQVQGYSCKYNQQNPYDITSQSYWLPTGVCTHTIDGNIETLTLTGTPSSATNCRAYTSRTPSYKNNYKYIIIYDIKASKVCRIVPAIYGNDYAYQFGTANNDDYVNANVWKKCCSFLTVNSSGTARTTYLNLYYNYANFVAGDTIQFKNVIIMNLTEAFGSGNEPNNASSFFATQIGKIIASGKHLEYAHNGGILNATAPFTFHYANETRQFTGNLTLRGVGSAYDTWKNSGQVERNFGEVDLGTLSWSYAGSVRWQCFNAQNVKSVAYSNKANALTDKYEIKSFYQAESTGVGLAIYNTYLYNYTSNSTSSPTGIMNYELATPTTDTTSKLVLPDNLIKVTDSNGAELTITKLF